MQNAGKNKAKGKKTDDQIVNNKPVPAKADIENNQ